MQTETPTSKRSPSLVQALTPLLVLIVLLSASVFIYGEDSSYGPNQIALWIASGVAIGIGFYNRLAG
jgi:NhaC family Na+:H+ antiporter